MALVDVGIAVLAGFLILPAMYVAAERGVMIFNEAGGLLSEDTLIFVVLPALFDSMNETGIVLALAFFGLMSIAALTSSISMLEVPVSFLVERFQWGRLRAAFIATAIITTMSAAIVMNFDVLFGLVITVSTRYSQPLLGLALCVYAGWWRRDATERTLQERRNHLQHILHALVALVCSFYLSRNYRDDSREIDSLSPSLGGAAHNRSELLAPTFQSGLKRFLHKITSLRSVSVDAGVNCSFVPVLNATGSRVGFEIAERFDQI